MSGDRWSETGEGGRFARVMPSLEIYPVKKRKRWLTTFLKLGNSKLTSVSSTQENIETSLAFLLPVRQEGA